MVTTLRLISRPIWRTATYLSSTGGSSRSPITRGMVRFPPPLIYMGTLLSGLAADRFVALSYSGIDRWLLVATGALLFAAGAAIMLAAEGLFRCLGSNIPPSRPTILIATTGPYQWSRNPMYLGMSLVYAGILATATECVLIS